MRFTRFALATLAATAAAPWTSASKCKKESDKYGCGACYEKPGYCDRPPGDGCHCCCHDEDGGDGGDFHKSTCETTDYFYWPKGCNSCMGKQACYGASNSLIGDDSCHYEKACKDMVNSNVKSNSCRGNYSCKEMNNTHVGTNSCEGDSACYMMLNSTITSNSCHLDGYSCSGMNNTHVGTNSCEGSSACGQVKDSTIGDYSCQYSGACENLKNSNIGDGSCNKYDSCDASWSFGDYGVGVTVGNNACNLSKTCWACENDSVVPDNSCNGDGRDITPSPCPSWDTTCLGQFPDGLALCNYCNSEYHSTDVQATISTGAGRRLTEAGHKKSLCQEVADKLRSFTIDQVKAHPTFKNFVQQDIADHCNGGETFSNAVEFISDPENDTCAIMIRLISERRWKNVDEEPLKDFIQEKVTDFCADESSDISCSFIEVTDTMIEKHCTKAAGTGSKSSKSSSTNEGAK
ncbi:hypothetical protein ACHAWC_001228, partial [Mediolabrus comicus]